MTAYRHDANGPLTTIHHDTPGQIVVRMTYDGPGCRTPLHAHTFEHRMVCERGAALVTLDGEQTVLRQGDSIVVPKGAGHSVLPLSSGTVIRCEHDVRRENGETDPQAFSADGVPVEWLQRLTETWGPCHVAG